MTHHRKASPPERYEGISRRLLEQAREEFDKGDILQASDKAWGAMAHAAKSICQRMGWNHHAHNHIGAAINYITGELNRDELLSAYVYLDSMHTNYYEHQRTAREVRVGIDNAAFLISELLAVPLSELPSDRKHLSSFERADQERLLRMLTRKNQYSHGPQLSAEEVAALPPVNPELTADGEGQD